MTTIQKYDAYAAHRIATLMGLNPDDVTDELRGILLDQFHHADCHCMQDGSILLGYIELLRLGVKAITQEDSIAVIAVAPELQYMIKDLRRSLKRLLPKEVKNPYPM